MTTPFKTILGIETSCDETAVAIIDETGHIHASLVLSQIEEHRAFGGVVPEIAARAHMDHLDTLITAAMDDAGLSFDQLGGVAATCGPGLIGGVMVGMMAGKAIAAARGIPFIAVNHLEGHALTPRLTEAGEGRDLTFPYLLLLISGGHTQILVAEGVGQYKRWATTLDDAAGECFDKSAKIMGLPYPGGPELQAIAATCTDPASALERFPLPRPMVGRKELDFSFSGLKTAVLNHVQKLPEGELSRKDVADLAHAFQTAMADILSERCERALLRFLNEYTPARPTLVVSGGVAANTAIRAALETLCAKHGAAPYAPPISLCGDNAAMIAWAGLERLRAGLTSETGDPLDTKARPRWPLDETAPTRHGAGVKA